MRRVTLTREPPRNAQLLEQLATAFDVVEVPLTSTRLVDLDDVRHVLEEITETPRVLVVTSARSAGAAALASQRFPDADVLAIGEVTAQALRTAGVMDVVVSRGEGVRDVANMITTGLVLSIGAREPREELADLLAGRGIEHRHVVAYETVARALSLAQQDRLRGSDVVVVSAPSAWRVAAPYVAASALVIAAGETTATAVRADHERVEIGSSAEEIVKLASS